MGRSGRPLPAWRATKTPYSASVGDPLSTCSGRGYWQRRGNVGGVSWAAPDVWDGLHRCYGHFDAEDAFAAFQATLELFSKLSRRVAAGFGLNHPTSIEGAVRPHVATLPDL